MEVTSKLETICIEFLYLFYQYVKFNAKQEDTLISLFIRLKMANLKDLTSCPKKGERIENRLC